MRLLDFRCIVQNKDGIDKYYPKVVSAFTTETFPWSAPVASIELSSNVSSGTAGYMSPIRNDDIVRLQANVRLSADEKPVWQNIFEGRIMSIQGTFGRNNLTTLICRGHGEEMLYRPFTTDFSDTTEKTGVMLANIVGTYLSRLTDDGLIDGTNSTEIPNFNVQLDTKFVSDVVKEFELLEGYLYVLKIVTSYDSDDNLDKNLVSWQPVPALSDTVKIIEGTPRLISAAFVSSIERVLEDVTIYGGGVTQVSGNSFDATPSYGTRYHVGVDTSILTAQLCEDLAVATRGLFGGAIVSGDARILGDPNIAVGDLIYCKIPSLVLDGASIDGNYRVKRMSHMINVDGWFTDVQLGHLIESPDDIIGSMHMKNRLTSANFID